MFYKHNVKHRRVKGAHRNVRGGLVFKAQRRLYHSTLGLRVIKKKKKKVEGLGVTRPPPPVPRLVYRGTSLITNSTPLGPKKGAPRRRSFPHSAHLRMSTCLSEHTNGIQRLAELSVLEKFRVLKEFRVTYKDLGAVGEQSTKMVA